MKFDGSGRGGTERDGRDRTAGRECEAEWRVSLRRSGSGQAKWQRCGGAGGATIWAARRPVLRNEHGGVDDLDTGVIPGLRQC